ncbi:mechanosensitive ion channel domain-containing protein [Litorimonas sp. RW-G-Af-16]|uniref:mechanosensitive ion channel domain-containing protein n=1 Tax=Litorimonas sp. RW-G-Af-16 TaxID=3241168 RepID=UPI00390C6CF9
MSWFADMSGLMQWVIGLIIVTPVVTVLLGEIIDRLRRNDSKFLRFFETVRAVVLPVVILFLLAKFVFRLPHMTTDVAGEDHVNILYAVILTVLYLTLAYAAFVFLQCMKQVKDPKAWANRIPSLFKSIAMALVFVMPVILFLGAWGIQVGNFAKYASLAVAATALALQDALSSITKGFLLVLDKPFAVGDWIEVDGVKGKVTDISWRSTRLQVAGNDIVVIPNLIISDNSVYNYTAEDISYRDDITLGFSYNDPPNKVKAILQSVLDDCKDVMTVPAPKIFTVSYDDFSIGYKIYFFIKEYISAMDQERIRDDIMNRVWYAADRGGISIPFPISVEAPPHVFAPDMIAIRKENLEFLSQNIYFGSLPEDTLRHLAQEAIVAPFAKGETLYRENDLAETIGVIQYGQISLTRHNMTAANEGEVARHGDIISEISLLGRRSNIFTATAMEDSQVLKFSLETLEPILEAHPDFARKFNHLVEGRMTQSNAMRAS